MHNLSDRHYFKNQYPELFSLGWHYLAEGSFNYAYRSQCKNFVLKVPKIKYPVTEDAERSLRIFQEIHPEYQEQTQLFSHNSHKGWILPYIYGREANDKEISKKLVEIFQKTDRVVIDAPVRNNFICTYDGKVVCIDVGFAFRFYPTLRHTPSQTSLEQWALLKDEYNHSFFQRYHFTSNFPQTLATIKSLIFLQQCLSEFDDIAFLHEYPDTARYLAYHYDLCSQINIFLIKKEIDEIIYHSMDKLKNRCITALMDYIKSRCYENEVFKNYQKNPYEIAPRLQLSWMSYLFRNHELTFRKIQLAQSHIKNLSICQSYGQVRFVINQFSDPEPHSNSRVLPSGLFQAFLKCKAYYEHNQEHHRIFSAKLTPK
jgi:hypothetical protein